MICLVLTPEQAAAIAGPAGAYSSLEAVALRDGRFVLPLAVLVDPDLEERRGMLGALPRADIPDEAWFRDEAE